MTLGGAVRDALDDQWMSALFLNENQGEAIMAVSAFFDESGKFKDHAVVSFGGVMARHTQLDPFSNEWARLLWLNGIEALSGKLAFNNRVPLGSKNDALGIDKRTEALMPFIGCIRKHLEVVSGIALDVAAFTALPSHYFQILGDDPFYTAFLRMILRVLELTAPRLRISIICDDEEQMAEPMYKIYRHVKRNWPNAKEAFAAISFADDEYLFGLQAADMVSSLFRREADKQFFGTAYDYEVLFAELTKQHEAHELIWSVESIFCNRAVLIKLADDIKSDRDARLQKGK